MRYAIMGAARSQFLTDRRVLCRRLLFLALVTTSFAALLLLVTLTLSAGGFDAVDLLLLVLFALATPWFVVGFWNAAIGFIIMRCTRDPAAAVMPQAAAAARAESRSSPRPRS